MRTELLLQFRSLVSMQPNNNAAKLQHSLYVIKIAATVVGDATHISEVIAISTNGAALNFQEECSLNAAHGGACTAIIAASESGSAFTTTAIITGTFPLQAIAAPTTSSAGLSRDARIAFAAIPLGLLALSPFLNL